MEKIYLRNDGNTYIGNLASKMCTDKNFKKLSAGLLAAKERLKNDKLYGLFQVWEVEGKDESGYLLTIRAAQETEQLACKYMGKDKILVIIE